MVKRARKSILSTRRRARKSQVRSQIRDIQREIAKGQTEVDAVVEVAKVERERILAEREEQP